MTVEPMTVMAAGGDELEVYPGDVWPLPYRGSHYTIRSGNPQIVGWRRSPLTVRADPFPMHLAEAVRKTKGHNGSFIVTASGAIVAKTRTDSEWIPRYVGRYQRDIMFPDINTSGESLKRGEHWTGLTFLHGEVWRVSPYAQGRNRLEWSAYGRVFRSTKDYPELIEACLTIRPRGGRIYLTEAGCIWMNVPDGGVSPNLRARLKELQVAQVNELHRTGKHASLRLLAERIQATGARPLYIGRISEFDGGSFPWTYFEGMAPVPERDEY